MVFGYTLPVSWRSTIAWSEPVREQTTAAAKKKFIIDLHKLFMPEPVLVQDIVAQNIGSHAAGQILNRLTRKVSARLPNGKNAYPTKPPSMAE